MMLVLDIAVAFAVALLCGLGAGGGGLMVLYLTSARGLSQINGQGINILFFLAASAGAFTVNIKNSRIDMKRAMILSVCGAATAIAGSLLASWVSQPILRRLYGGLLVLSGIYYIISSKQKTDPLNSKGSDNMH